MAGAVRAAVAVNATQAAMLHSNFSAAAHHPHMPPPDPEDMWRAMLVFYLLFMFGFQSALVYWRRRHRRSYELVTLLGLWLVPAIIAARAGFWRFLATWALYSGVTGRFLFWPGSIWRRTC